MRLIKYIFYTLTLLILAACFLAPVSKNLNNEYQIQAETEIESSLGEVYAYMGQSNTVKEWSVYVDHITVLEGKDGETGCLRRCFKQADEQGIRWDEKILESNVNESRVLNIFHAVGFPIYSEGLITSQVFTEKDNFTGLELVLRLSKEANFWDHVKFRLSSYYIRTVFSKNLKGIKKVLENK